MRVLVVDDDVRIVRFVSSSLRLAGHSVCTATGGEEALALVESLKPDVMVLDILMPVADGFTFADQFRKDPTLAKTPVLALTSFSESLGQPFAFDVSEFISKPIKPRDLVAKVETFLKKAGK